MERSWYTASLDQIKTQCEQNPHLGWKEKERFCRENYPWTYRRGWAYTAWRKAMHEVFGQRQRPNLANQQQHDLFGGEA